MRVYNARYMADCIYRLNQDRVNKECLVISTRAKCHHTARCAFPRADQAECPVALVERIIKRFEETRAVPYDMLPDLTRVALNEIPAVVEANGRLA